MKITISAIFLLLVALMVLSCKKDESRKPVMIKFTVAQDMIEYVGDTVSHVGVQVLNNEGAPIGGVLVTFQMENGSATLSTNSGMTDANGMVYTDITFGTSAGNTILTASSGGVMKNLEFKLSSSHASKITMVSGDQQSGIATQGVENQLTVLVTDDYGTPATGVMVTFSIEDGDGKLGAPSAITGTNGQASVIFYLGPNSLSDKITASISAGSVGFTIYSNAVPVLNELIKSTTGITLTWEQAFSHNLTGYTVSRSDSGGPWVVLANLNANALTFTDNNLIQTIFYQYKVTAVTTDIAVDSQVQGIFFGTYAVLDDVPEHMVINEARQQAYVSIPSRNEIEMIDLTSGQIIDKIYIGSDPQRMNLSHDGATLYVALGGSGKVAFLNLDTKAVSTIDVQSALGDPRAFDVIEAAPGRVFVTGNPGENGDSFIVLIKTDQNNMVVRFFNEIVRDHPIMQVQYGNALYVMESNDLYKLDPLADYSSQPYGTHSPNIRFQSNYSHLSLNPDGRIYADNQEISADLTTLGHTFGQGGGIISPDVDGQVLAFYAPNSIQWLNANTYQQLTQLSFTFPYVSEIQSSMDAQTCYALVTDYTAYSLWIIKR